MLTACCALLVCYKTELGDKMCKKRKEEKAKHWQEYSEDSWGKWDSESWGNSKWNGDKSKKKKKKKKADTSSSHDADEEYYVSHLTILIVLSSLKFLREI